MSAVWQGNRALVMRVMTKCSRPQTQRKQPFGIWRWLTLLICLRARTTGSFLVVQFNSVCNHSCNSASTQAGQSRLLEAGLYAGFERREFEDLLLNAMVWACRTAFASCSTPLMISLGVNPA